MSVDLNDEFCNRDTSISVSMTSKKNGILVTKGENFSKSEKIKKMSIFQHTDKSIVNVI